MKKLVGITGLLVVMLLSFTACGGDTKDAVIWRKRQTQLLIAG